MEINLKRSFLVQLLSVLTLNCGNAQNLDSLYSNFKNPPNNTKLWVYWYVMDGYLNKEGITADLEAMAKSWNWRRCFAGSQPGWRTR